MFSEYASRFLAQSQSRLSLGQPEQNNSTRNPSDRQRGASRFPASRSYLQRPAMYNPYQPNASPSRFPFTSRTQTAPAPLFYSATDDFREEDDGEEHEREAADYYALQQSRRHFGASHLTESSELDEDAAPSSPAERDDNGARGTSYMKTFGTGRGIKSSWTGPVTGKRGRTATVGTVAEQTSRERSSAESETSAPSSKGKGKLVDVELESTVRGSVDVLDKKDAAEDLTDDMDDHPPAFQQFRNPPTTRVTRPPMLSSLLPQETDEETAFARPRPSSPDRESVPPGVALDTPEPPRHDSFWATLFWICFASMFATFLLVYLHTSAPSKDSSLKDTIYTTLHASFHLLAVYTLVAVIVGFLWLAMLRSFVRPLVLLLLVAVPVILTSFSLYPLVSSYKGHWNGGSPQDKVMRWLALVPGIFAALWTYQIHRNRHSLEKATEILEFACRILANSPALLLVGFGTLTAIVAWTWLWILMFTRVFLGGHMSKRTFVIDGSTWWLGVFFVLVYLWSRAIISGIQRATTAATVSQWYFHRFAIPAPPSRAVVQASLAHATGALFGTICLSTLISLAVRLPLVVLPRRLASIFALCAYSLIPTPIGVLTNPLTLTYAAIHSQSLDVAARGLSQMSFVSKTSPSTALAPGSFAPSSSGNTLIPYRLAKSILFATRAIMSLSLGFGGWVSTARMLEIPGSTFKGSVYAYVVGLVAGFIGYGVLGAMEGVLGGIVDAVVVCWGSEVGAMGRGEARYCREAGELFGERGIYS